MTTEVTVDNLDETLASDKLVVIDFWAEWCAPCKMLGPIIDKISEEISEGEATIGKCDIDANPDIAVKYAIRNIPTVLLIKNGEVVDKFVGVKAESDISDLIKANL